MRNVLAASIATVVALWGSPALAQKSTEEAIKGTKGRYGDAGCGLGALAFGDQQGPIQIVAATLNATGVQTFAITTGTSNCHGISGSQTSRIFIEANREALAKDISRGSGEALGTLTWIAGCADSRSVGAALQRSFTVIFPDEKTPDTVVSETIVRMLKTDATLACQNLTERT